MFWGLSSDMLKIKNTVFNSNEDIVMITEESTITADVNNRTLFFYGDIISFKISEKGELIWAKNINKKQGISNINKIANASHATLSKNNIIFFFFNANEVKQLENNQVSFNFKKTDNDLYLITINENGESNYKKLNNKLKNITVEVRFGVLLNEHSLLFEATTLDNKPLLVKISL